MTDTTTDIPRLLTRNEAAAALREIADSILSLRQLHTSPAERYEAGGRLVAKALKLGAFADNIDLRTHVEMRLEMPQGEGLPDPFISAWAEMGDRLRYGAGPFPDRDLDEAFDEDCEIIARALLSEADAEVDLETRATQRSRVKHFIEKVYCLTIKAAMSAILDYFSKRS